MSLENNEQNTGGIDLRILLSDFGRVVRRTWLLGVVLMLLFSGIFSLKAKMSYRPMYRASATFTVYVVDPLQSEVRGYNTATAEQMAKTFPYILTSGALKDMVKRDLDIPALPPVFHIEAVVLPHAFEAGVFAGEWLELSFAGHGVSSPAVISSVFQSSMLWFWVLTLTARSMMRRLPPRYFR